MKISELGEFGLIGRLQTRLPATDGSILASIGDDCAVLSEPGSSLLRLQTTDVLVEGVHFLPDVAPSDLGYKALAVNLSDVAAMGGRPKHVLLSWALPRDFEVEWVDAFLQGFLGLAAEAGVSLIGGDTTGTPGPLFISITAEGEVERDHLKLRRGAQAGDRLFVTSTLGDSDAGLRLLLGKLDRSGGPAQRALRRHLRPRPHLKEGAWLGGRREVRAMMDMSDGLVSDAQRIAETNGLRIFIDADRLPIAPETRELATLHGWDVTELAATGGEDYGLLVSVDPRLADSLAMEFASALGRPLHEIGRVEPGSPGVEFVSQGRRLDWKRGGFRHF